MSVPAASPDSARPGPAVVPLPVGATLDRGFGLLGRRPRSLLVPALLLHLVPLVVAMALAAIGTPLLGDVATVSEQVRESTFFGDSTLETREVANLTDGQAALVVVLAVLGAIVFVWFGLAAYAAVIRGAQRALAGDDPLSLGDALRDALRQAPRLFGLTVVALVVLGVGSLVAGLVLLGAYALSTAAAAVVGLGVGVLLVFLVTRLLLLPVVAVVETRGVDAFGRAWALSRDRFWALLGLGALLLVVVTAVNVVATLVLEAAFGALNALDTTVGTWVLIPYAGLTLVVGVVFAAVFLAPLVVAHRTVAAERGPAASDAPSAA